MRQLSGLARPLLIFSVTLACLVAESYPRPHSAMAQEKKTAPTQKSSESAQQSMTHAIGSALQGDAASAAKMLLDVPALAFAGEDLDWRSCMIARFGPSAMPAVPTIDDPWMAKLARIYVTYWQRSLTQTAERNQAEQDLKEALEKLVGRSAGTEDGFDALEKEITAEAQNHGFHVLLGVTSPLHELMAWKKQTVEQRQVLLPEGPYSAKVTLMDDFILRGWGYYATCGRRSTGGWTTTEGLFAVVPAYESLDDETFSVRFLAHETQHFADKHNFEDLESWELEYRAKLTELALAVSSQDSTLQLFCENRSQVNDSAHAYADFHVIRDIEDRLKVPDSDLCGSEKVRGQAIRDAAKAILVRDSGMHKAQER